MTVHSASSGIGFTLCRTELASSDLAGAREGMKKSASAFLRGFVNGLPKVQKLNPLKVQQGGIVVPSIRTL